MPYLNLDLDYFTHPKVVRLVGLLGPEAALAPIRLWCYVGKYHCATGMLQAMLVSEIEEVAQWKGKSDTLVTVLVKLKFLEKMKHGYRVHDWLEHAGHLMAFKKRAQSAAKKRWQDYATSIAVSNRKPPVSNAPNHPNLPYQPNLKSDIKCLWTNDGQCEGKREVGSKYCRTHRHTIQQAQKRATQSGGLNKIHIPLTNTLRPPTEETLDTLREEPAT